MQKKSVEVPRKKNMTTYIWARRPLTNIWRLQRNKSIQPFWHVGAHPSRQVVQTKKFCFWPSGTHLNATTQHVAFQQTLIGLFRNLWYGSRQDDIQNGKNCEECAACASDEMKARRRQWRFSKLGLILIAGYLSMYPLWADVYMCDAIFRHLIISYILRRLHSFWNRVSQTLLQNFGGYIWKHVLFKT